MFVVTFVAGCHEPSHPIAPSLFGICKTGGTGDFVHTALTILLLAVWVFGLSLSIPAAIRHRRSPRGLTLASTLVIATAVAVIVSAARWAALGPSSIFGSAAVVGLCTLVIGPIVRTAVVQLARNPQA